jgi:hypothetical protein
MENRVMLGVLFAIVAVVGGGWYYFSHKGEETHLEIAKPQPRVEETKPVEPEIRHPLQPESTGSKPLPALAESDATVNDAFAQFIDKDSLKRYFNLDSLIRRVIVTVDNLPRKKIPQMYTLAKPVEGKFQVAGADYAMSIKPENYRRYTLYVKMLESIDTKKLVAAYVHFYPLLQEEYKNIASPKQYFNDRVVEVIDHMLAAPEIQGPIRLVQPKVFYQFAEPALEDLSAGQKIMIRIGPDNAMHVKAKLQEIRKEITAVR